MRVNNYIRLSTYTSSTLAGTLPVMTSPHASVVLNDDLDETASLVLLVPTTTAAPKPRFSFDDDSMLTLGFYGLGDAPSLTALPLGPNSIYELTVGSDVARIRNKRGLKHQVVINGGLTTVYNLTTPTTRDIPQIHLTKLRHKVPKEKLSPWLETGDEYKTFERGYSQLTQDTLASLAAQSAGSDGLVGAQSEGFVGQDVAVPLSEVPSVFMDPNFRLDDPRIFSKVVDNVAILPSSDEQAATSLAHNTDLQDKFSRYLDIIEQNLVVEIGKLLELFFSALGDISNIQLEAANCVEAFDTINFKLAKAKHQRAEDAKQIVGKLLIAKNVEYLELALLHLECIRKFHAMAIKEHRAENYSECLDLVMAVSALVEGVSFDDFTGNKKLYPKFQFPIENVLRIPGLATLIQELKNLKHDCAKGFLMTFTNVLVDDLRDHCQSVPTSETLDRLYYGANRRHHPPKTINRSYQVMDSDRKSLLQLLVAALIKLGHVVQGYRNYQDRLLAEVKAIIQENLPAPSVSSSRASPGPGQQSANTDLLSGNIRSLTPKEFEDMMVKTYCDLSECLRRLTTHQKVLLDVALSLDDASGIDVMSLDILGAINRAVELTQIRLTKIVNVRLQQTGDLPVAMYLRLYAILSAYLVECESIDPAYVATGAGNLLSEWFSNHVNYFAHRVHSRALKSLVNSIDKEVWREASAEDLTHGQFVVDEIVAYADYVHTQGRVGDSGERLLAPLNFSSTQEEEDAMKPKSVTLGRLTIGSEQFMVPAFIISALNQVRDYLTIYKMFPLLETTTNNVLNYFKLLNSRTSQAILNAGATKTAGLKHITTRHIALCIQTVEFVLSWLVKVEDILPAPASTDNNLTFALVLLSYREHESELFNKLVSIMRDRTIGHCKTILATDWSQSIAPGSQCHPYMETIVRETLRVAKVLSRFLPELKCSHILSQVFDTYKKLLILCYCAELPQLKDMMEKQMVLKDIDFFRVSLCDLPGYGNSGQVIWENVNALPTLEDLTLEQQQRLEEERIKLQEAARREEERIEREKAELEAKQAAEAEKAEAEARNADEEASRQVAETLFEVELAGRLSEEVAKKNSEDNDDVAGLGISTTNGSTIDDSLGPFVTDLNSKGQPSVSLGSDAPEGKYGETTSGLSDTFELSNPSSHREPSDIDNLESSSALVETDSPMASVAPMDMNMVNDPTQDDRTDLSTTKYCRDDQFHENSTDRDEMNSPQSAEPLDNESATEVCGQLTVDASDSQHSGELVSTKVDAMVPVARELSDNAPLNESSFEKDDEVGVGKLCDNIKDGLNDTAGNESKDEVAVTNGTTGSKGSKSKRKKKKGKR